MNREPTKVYVYQPLSPTPDGRFYGVSGLHLRGLPFDEATIKGVTKADAEKIAKACNDYPDNAARFVRIVKEKIEKDWNPSCGCRFESLFSSAVLLCEECSKLPCHNPK